MSVYDPENNGRGQNFWRLVKPPGSYGVKDIAEINALLREWPVENGYAVQHQDKYTALRDRLNELRFSDPNSREAAIFWSKVKSPGSYSSSEADIGALDALLRQWPKVNGRPLAPKRFTDLLNRLQLLRYTVDHPQPPSGFRGWFHGAPPTPPALQQRNSGTHAQKEQERLVGLINQRAADVQKGARVTLSTSQHFPYIGYELNTVLYTPTQVADNFARMCQFFAQNVRDVVRITQSTRDNQGHFSISFLQANGDILVLRSQSCGTRDAPAYLITLAKD